MFEHLFEDGGVAAVSLASLELPAGVSLGVAGVRQPATRTAPAPTDGLRVPAALAAVLPGGLPRGQTVSVGGRGPGALSLLLALLAAASADGAWCALVDLGPREVPGAEALADLGLVLDRVVVVRPPASGWSRAGWVTTVGALVDAFDLVAVRPETRPVPGDLQRLAGRVRARGSVLVPYVPAPTMDWPGSAVRLRAGAAAWSGLTGGGGGRLRARRLELSVEQRGQEARPQTATLWLPDPTGSIGQVDPTPATDDAGRPALEAVR